MRVETEETPTSRHLRLIDRAGNELGRMRFHREGESVVVIEHTEVDSSLRGHEGGRQLFEKVVAWARRCGYRVRSQCPFTARMFDRTPSAQDIRA